MSDLIYRQDAVTIPVMPKRYRHYMSINLDDVYEQGWEDLQLCIEHFPSAQPERPEQPESAKEYCAECNHIEMCQWYPYEGCEFRSIPSAQLDERLKKLANLLEGTIDHFDRDAAMDLLYQIKEVLKND